jgi:SAM-dependent methyltransferase
MNSDALTSGGVSKSSSLASPEEVEAFLRTTSFSGYQAVPLPHGRRVPGEDRMASVEAVFGHGIEGGSVLDVGTYYGRFLYEAKARGAARAVGVELDPGRWSIADRIAALHGRTYDVLKGRIEDVELDERFDLVLVLNVLHHVPDPVAVMRRAASLCRGVVIVEFPMADHPGYISDMLSRDGAPGLRQRAVAQAYSAACAWWAAACRSWPSVATTTTGPSTSTPAPSGTSSRSTTPSSMRSCSVPRPTGPVGAWRSVAFR